MMRLNKSQSQERRRIMFESYQPTLSNTDRVKRRAPFGTTIDEVSILSLIDAADWSPTRIVDPSLLCTRVIPNTNSASVSEALFIRTSNACGSSVQSSNIQEI